jgi:ADP-heptose:LPS heptosyltransferase
VSSPLHGRYLVQNPLWNAWLRGSDSLLELLGAAEDSGIPAAPRRMLLHVGGHRGDAVVATAVLAPLLAKWPNLEIGVLTGSWNRQVFAGIPAIKWIHHADHWKLDRSPGSFLSRASRSAASSRSALRDIRRIGYDVAIDLYAWYPNAGALLRRAGIPVRVGYTSGGGGPHFTRRVDWQDSPHLTQDHARLLAVLGVEMRSISTQLPPLPAAAVEKAMRELEHAGVQLDRYVVLNMGTGTPIRRWPPEEWKELASRLVREGISVVLTGFSPGDQELTRSLTTLVPSVKDMCNRFDWNESGAVLANARAVITVDTVTGHVGGALGTPTIVVSPGIDKEGWWKPVGERVVVVSQRVPCAPCHRSRGCATMDCIRQVKAARVWQALTPFLT